MRRIFLMLILVLTASACTLTDDLSALLMPPSDLGLDDLIATLPTGRAEDGAFYLGSPDAPVTIIVFEDWYCPHCQNYKPTIDQLIETYVAGGQARYERRVLPTAGGESAVILGQWMECVAEYGANYFIANNDLYDMMTASPVPPTQAGAALVETFGLSLEKVQICAETADQVDIDGRFADELGANSTPSVWIRYADGRTEAVADRSFDGLSALIEGKSPGDKVASPFPIS